MISFHGSGSTFLTYKSQLFYCYIMMLAEAPGLLDLNTGRSDPQQIQWLERHMLQVTKCIAVDIKSNDGSLFV